MCDEQQRVRQQVRQIGPPQSTVGPRRAVIALLLQLARQRGRLERQVGKRWVTVQRKRIGTSGGQYATKVRPTKAGLYRVSIIATGVTRQRTSDTARSA